MLENVWASLLDKFVNIMMILARLVISNIDKHKSSLCSIVNITIILSVEKYKTESQNFLGLGLAKPYSDHT